MRGGAWEPDRESLQQARMFEYTDKVIAGSFKANNPLSTASGSGQAIDFEALKKLPCLFMQEGIDDEVVRAGRITSVRSDTRSVHFEYTVESGLPPLTNRDVYNYRGDFGLYDDFEFSRNHWAVKGVDLYRAILKASQGQGPSRSRPKVFWVPDREKVDPALISVMMPFDAGLRSVFEDIKAMAKTIGMQCKRGDDIWFNDTIIQDVVDLIDMSKIVICDLTNRNANVFYEAGIAHTLGRDIILITQNSEDVPFDLRHYRHIKYLNNAEGRADLCDTLKQRIGTIVT